MVPEVESPVFPEPVIDVLPKLAVILLFNKTPIPLLVGFVMVVPPELVKVPLTETKYIPSAAEFVEEILVNVAAKAPVLRSNA